MVSQQEPILIPILGWVYFVAWSISFYGQIYENFRTKSVEGMNFDFVAMNLTGFLLYSVYNTYGYFVDSQQTGRVDLNDLIFSYHALFATLVTVSQIIIYPYKSNRIHRPTMIFLMFIWASCIIYGTLTLQFEWIRPEPRLGVVSFMGYYKLAISSLKYLPQFYWNYKRKSTKGWSIFNILMDLTGGLFSFGQMIAEALYGIEVQINIVKLVLGIMVVFYDIGFVIQHYCIYPNRQPKSDLVPIHQQNLSTGQYHNLQNEVQIEPEEKTEEVVNK